jgi:hypothetical protein
MQTVEEAIEMSKDAFDGIYKRLILLIGSICSATL